MRKGTGEHGSEVLRGRGAASSTQAWLLAAAGISEAAAVAAIDGAGGLRRGNDERQNSGRDESEFDDQSNHGNPQGALTRLVVAPVGSAAMARRQNWRRKNHRNEGQGKKQINHKGKSPRNLLRRRKAQSACEWTIVLFCKDGEWLVGGRAWPVGGRGCCNSRAHLGKARRAMGPGCHPSGVKTPHFRCSLLARL